MALKEDLEPKRLGYYLIILAIAFVFAVQWGPGSRGCDSPLKPPDVNTAARVNGREITRREFNQAYANYLAQWRRVGQELTEAQAREMGLPQRILDDLVNNELMAQEAERQGIVASDDEVLVALRANRDFYGEDGKFAVTHYKDALRNYYRKTPQEYEQAVRRELSVEKLRRLLGESAQVSDEEVKEQYFREGNRARLTYVRFAPTMYAGKVGEPTPADVEAYRKAHEKEIAGDYAANAYVYQQPEKVRARHILVKVARNATREQKDAARAKVDALKKQLDGGKDFAELAKEVSEDVSKPQGGDLGLQPREAWVPEFSAAAFALKVGEVSAPVESPFGFHLIKVEEKKAAESKPLEAVAGEIARKLWAKERSSALAKAEAEKALAAARGGKKLEELYPASKAKLQFETAAAPEAKTSEEFNVKGDAVPQLPPTPELLKDVAAQKGEALLDGVYPAGEGWLVARVDSRTIPSEETFVREQAKLRESMMRAKQDKVRETYVQALRKRAQLTLGKDLTGPAEEG